MVAAWGGYIFVCVGLPQLCSPHYAAVADSAVDRDFLSIISPASLEMWPRCGHITRVDIIFPVDLGHVIRINMVAIHAAALCCLGRYTSKLHRAYTLFFVIGTFGAIQVWIVFVS